MKVIRKKKKVLVIGSTSKIAKEFISRVKDLYDLHLTHNREALGVANHKIKQYELDLSTPSSINNFIGKISDITFDALVIFASTYVADPPKKEELINSYFTDVSVNAASSMVISKNIQFNFGSKIIFLGDNGTSLPKKGYSSYSLSKLLVENLTSLLAVELAPKVSTICIKLGPTIQDIKSTKKNHYYDRGLIQVVNPAEGLVNLINFLINEPNLNTTGCIMNYDGGIYLRRYH